MSDRRKCPFRVPALASAGNRNPATRLFQGGIPDPVGVSVVARALTSRRAEAGLVIAAVVALAIPVRLPAQDPATTRTAPASRYAPSVAHDTGQSTLPSAATARAAFDRLKTLAGDWEGTSTDATTGDVYFDRALFDYRLTGAGSALIEFANAGTPDEMLSIFFMDGDRLVLQHYCSVANQPRLELISADSTGLLFDLVGGVNLDPTSDGHIHRVRFNFDRDGGVESLWTWFDEGREHHVNRRVIVQRRKPR
jgi:hypothetical protein